MRGKLGGQVHSRNTFGNFVRAKVSPVQPRTFWQSKARSIFLQLSKRFSTELTDDQRAAWKAFAEDYPVSDVFGNPVILTALNFYLRVNSVRLRFELSLLDDPPPDFFVQDLTWADLTIHVPPSPYICVYFRPSPIPENHVLEFWATAPLSPGISPCSAKMRYICAFSAGLDSPRCTSADYIRRFGPPVKGRKIIGLARLVNVTNGAVSRGVIVSRVA